MSRLLLGFLAVAGFAAEPEPVSQSGLDRDQKALLLNAGVAVGIATYGVLFWDYGTSSPRIFDEGWFGRDSLHGGLDKLGHAFTNLVGTTLFSRAYDGLGYSERDATVLGGLSTFAATLLVEVGDSFSQQHGFSPQDIVFNGLGVGFGMLRRTYPQFRRTVDLRMEYLPSPAMRRGDGNDPTTDYAGQRYLLALKGEAFAAAPSVFHYLEVHLGYYARGFEPGNTFDPPQRRLYVGLALNLGAALESAFGTRAGSVFSYYQPPFTSWRFSEHLD